MRTLIIATLIIMVSLYHLFGQQTNDAEKTIYCNVRELQNTNQATMTLTLLSNSASFWINQDGYPLKGDATLTKTNLVIIYTNLPFASSSTYRPQPQVWQRKRIMQREFLFGPVAIQLYETHGLVTYDALIRLSPGESTNDIPSAKELGITVAK